MTEVTELFTERTLHKMNGEALYVNLYETLAMNSPELVQQMSQWTQRPTMDRF